MLHNGVEPSKSFEDYEYFNLYHYIIIKPWLLALKDVRYFKSSQMYYVVKHSHSLVMLSFWQNLIVKVQDRASKVLEFHKVVFKFGTRICKYVKFLTMVVVLIVASIWLYRSLSLKESQAIFFQLYPKHKNVSIVTMSISKLREQRRRSLQMTHGDNMTPRQRGLRSSMWKVEGTYTFFYIKAVINKQIFMLDIDSGSALTWVNCEIKKLNLGPSEYLVITTHNKLFNPSST